MCILYPAARLVGAMKEGNSETPSQRAERLFREGRRDALPYFMSGCAAKAGERISPVRGHKVLIGPVDGGEALALKNLRAGYCAFVF